MSVLFGGAKQGNNFKISNFPLKRSILNDIV